MTFLQVEYITEILALRVRELVEEMKVEKSEEMCREVGKEHDNTGWLIGKGERTPGIWSVAWQGKWEAL